MSARFIMFHMLEDPEFLRAVGVVSIRHGHLDHMLRMTIKVLANISVDDAVLGTASLGSAALRKRVRKLARKELGDGPAFIKLEALLERCRLVSESRHEVIHGLFAKERVGEPLLKNRLNEWGPPPPTQKLDELGEQIRVLTDELNVARLNGFLVNALIGRRHGTAAPAKESATWGKQRQQN